MLLQLGCASKLSEDLAKIPIKILFHMIGMRPNKLPDFANAAKSGTKI